MNESQITVQSALIGANNIIKSVLFGKTKIDSRELAEQVGEEIWRISEILGIELD